MTHSDSGFYKIGFWVLIIAMVIMTVIYVTSDTSIERIEPDPDYIPTSLMIQANDGWIILNEAEEENKTITVGKKVIYVTTRVIEHPSCSGCHSQDMEHRKISKDLRCPTWIDNTTGDTQ